MFDLNRSTGEINNTMRPDKKISDGKRAELLAAELLMAHGCHVYMPVLEQGPIDLIAIAPEGEVFYFDVKKAGRRKDGSIISRRTSDIQKKLGVRLLYVDLDTGQCALYPHQLSYSPNNNATKYAAQKASNRHFSGGRVLTMIELLLRESSQKAQSLNAKSSQCEHPLCPSRQDPHTAQDDADQSGDTDPPTEF